MNSYQVGKVQEVGVGDNERFRVFRSIGKIRRGLVFGYIWSFKFGLVFQGYIEEGRLVELYIYFFVFFLKQ